MRKRSLIWLLILLMTGLMLPIAPVSADGEPPDDGVILWNEDYVLGEGENLDGDLIVFNGDVKSEVDSRIEGDAIVWNGNIDVRGTIDGLLIVSGGEITLGENAYVKGDIICGWNCEIKQAQGARVDGTIIKGLPLGKFLHVEQWQDTFRIPIRISPWLSSSQQVLEWVVRTIRTMVTILIIAAMAGVVGLIWPQATERVGSTAFENPGPSFGIGLLTLVAAITLIIALVITICLSPAAVLTALTLGAAGLFGWVGIGTLIGKRLLQALSGTSTPGPRETAPMWAAGLGTLVITMISMGLSAALCLAPLGWLLTLVLGCLGLGAVVLTRFGTTLYVPERSRPAPAAPPPALTEGGEAAEEASEPSEPVDADTESGAEDA